MIQSFFKRLSFTRILFIFLVFISLNCFTFFLLNNSDYYTSFLTEEDPSFSLSALPSIPKTGIHFRVAHDSSSSREDTFLLLRFLFPSDSLLNFWRYNELSKPDMSPLIHSAHLKILSPMEEESFRKKINFKNIQKRLRLSAQPDNFLFIDQAFALLSDDWEFKGPVKPSGRLVINSKYPRYCFPVSWPFFFKDSFGDSRGGHRLHLGIDIFAEEGTEVYAVTDGVIQQLVTWKGAGNTILLRGKDGKGYIYMHLHEYAEGISEGKPVKKGELIAFVGHTGTQSSAPHLHFQVHADQSFSKDCALNPYEALVSLCQGRGVTDLGSPKPHFSQVRELPQRIFSSEASRQSYFLLGKRLTSIKSNLIESRDGGPAFGQETGLDWRVPNPTWKVPQAKFILPADKSETPPSSTRVTWTWPKRKPSAKLVYP
jgi:murein DD-endopeptidase MepM/ murein hydrolase activator NlpD